MQIIVFIGIQATGKSTFYKEHFFNSHVRISMDLLNTRNKENKFIQTCFDTQAQFVVDNTNPSKKDRERYIHQAKNNKYEIIGYYFQSSLKEALERNSQRTGKEKIPDVGIRGCYAKLELPSYQEGFDQLYYVTPQDEGFKIENWQDEV